MSTKLIDDESRFTSTGMPPVVYDAAPTVETVEERLARAIDTLSNAASTLAAATPAPPKAKRIALKQYGGRAEDMNNEPGHLATQFLLAYYTAAVGAAAGSRLLHCYHHQFYRYVGTHYEVMDEGALKDELYAYIREHATSKRTSGLLDVTWKFLRSEVRLKDDRKINTWLSDSFSMRAAFVALKNGILDLDHPDAGLRPHTPDWFATVCLPFEYTPEACCENWLVFLQSCFNEDAEREALLQEWFGYCLTPDTSLQKFMLLEGPTRAGKGITANVLVHILGDDEKNANVSHIALENLDKRFDITWTAGKLLNVCDETDQIERVAEAVLKRFTGATAKFFYDVKGKPGFEETVTARLLIITNNGIPIYDRSSALVARMLHLAYEKSHDGKEDTTLLRRLYGEVEGIFNWALLGYARIRASQEFTVPAVMKEALKHYREQSNPFKVWFDEHVEYTFGDAGAGDTLGKLEVLSKHNEWLKEHGHRPIADNTCARQIRLLCHGIKEGRETRFLEADGKGKQVRTWVGLKWRTD